MHWHDHTHEGDAPMIWLDAPDYPLVNALEAGFHEKYHQRLQPVTRADDAGSRQFLHGRLNPVRLSQGGPNSPVPRYTWQETQRSLEGIADTAEGSDVDGIVLEYTDPWTGGPVMPAIGCRIQRLRPGFQGAGRRHTASTIFDVDHHVEGATIVDGVRLDWSEHDTFAVPGWASYRHLNASTSDDAVLFSYSDEPVMRSLGLYRAESADPGA
ncbi:cupin domain-containing protein [Streptomyces sp. NBC_01358]|uniref:cupin domain-containing protein n=1 Tax=Streptomyces sp. NBC_01358 TaxID=2903837 RepID=UPI002E2FEEC4|nr:hypothetical protein [Streptomyces sp. NBC_01358]